MYHKKHRCSERVGESALEKNSCKIAKLDANLMDKNHIIPKEKLFDYQGSIINRLSQNRMDHASKSYQES